MTSQTHLGLAGKIAQVFINSKLTPLVVIASVLLGVAAVILLPREEEPQIKVPMIDVMVQMPGFSAKEVEERATRPMEQLLWEIPGVEYIYSMSRPQESLVIVRFKVGESVEESLIKLNQKLQSNFDRIPPGVSKPLIKPKSIDDVPILALTFHSSEYDHYTLRRIANEVNDSVKQVPEVAETSIIGGTHRQIKVLADPVRLAARGLTLAGLVPMLEQANRQYISGAVTNNNREYWIETGAFLTNAADVGNVVVGVYSGRPVYLRDVADIEDGAEEPANYVLYGAGGTSNSAPEEAAVTLTIAKRPGTNAIDVADSVLKKVELLKGQIIPSNVTISTTRHYGETAAEKANELLFHMAIAVVSVSLLILFVLGWRESIIVAIAIPATLALTLLVFYLHGFTLNRITLFALIFSIGILVDDAIVVVENIVRHFQLSDNTDKSYTQIAIHAVSEVGNPTILATFAVIAAVLPMALVGGLMGPYMRPIPVGASAAMLFSLLIAFIVTPWATIRIVTWGRSAISSSVNVHDSNNEDYFTKLYRKAMTPLIHRSFIRNTFLFLIVLLLLASFSLVGFGWVQVKMLPFDNKSEFQVILNMPEDSALETTTAVAREIAASIKSEIEVDNYQVYSGVASPFNFNGLVRHYYLRQGSNVADIQVNLVNKSQRHDQSHDIVKRLRPRIAAIADRYHARVAVAEIPPGPPVLQTLVAEIYGPTATKRIAFASKLRETMKQTPGVVDIDWYVESERQKFRFVIDKEKAALHGITAETISRTLAIAVEGAKIDLIHQPSEKEDLNLILRLPLNKRTSAEDLLALYVRTGDANALPEPITQGDLPPLVPLRELVKIEQNETDKTIHHKNLLPVTYVTADVAGEIESPVYAIMKLNRLLAREDMQIFGNNNSRLNIYNAVMPFNDQEVSLKWDGEWQITIEVFRDLGLAFIAVLIIIYILMVGWFKSFLTPLTVMVAIPFSLIGILPAHGALGAFFTATSMIGFMAGAGIVVRNSIILVDFIELRIQEGMPLAEAVIDAGAVRFRPMLLTALAVIVGASVILFDPIFQGLAISLMAGEVASLLISRMAVPILYYMENR